jgi:hypothetical protein
MLIVQNIIPQMCRLEKTADQVSEILAIANITGVPSLFFIQEKR